VTIIIIINVRTVLVGVVVSAVVVRV